MPPELEVVQAMLLEGRDVNFADKRGQTVMKVALENQFTPVAVLFYLIEKGASRGLDLAWHGFILVTQLYEYHNFVASERDKLMKLRIYIEH